MPILYSQFAHENLIYLDRKQPSKIDAIKLLLGKGKSLYQKDPNRAQERMFMLKNDLKRYRILRAMRSEQSKQ